MLETWGWASATVVVLVLVVGCSGDSEVEQASCNACSGKSFTEDDCKTAGEAAGCETSSFVATVTGCTNGCSFQNCRVAPECGGTKRADAGSTADAGRNPACETTRDGLFSVNPPCSDTSTVTINGATQYACKCGAACPCGFVCGSIPLSTGGALGNVCAPP